MNYMLAIYVPPDAFNTDVAEQCLDGIRALEPQPSRILLVDHAQGLSPAVRNPELRTRQGEPLPVFAARRNFHEMADETLAMFRGRDLLLGQDEARANADLRRWRGASAFKAFALRDALAHDLDAVLTLRVPDTITPEAPRYLLKALGQWDHLSCVWTPMVTTDWLGQEDGNGVLNQPEATSMGQFIPTWGLMMRTDPRDIEFLDPALEARAEGKEYSDTLAVRLALMSRGEGLGISHGGNTPLVYRFRQASPLHELWSRNWVLTTESLEAGRTRFQKTLDALLDNGRTVRASRQREGGR